MFFLKSCVKMTQMSRSIFILNKSSEFRLDNHITLYNSRSTSHLKFSESRNQTSAESILSQITDTIVKLNLIKYCTIWLSTVQSLLLYMKALLLWINLNTSVLNYWIRKENSKWSYSPFRIYFLHVDQHWFKKKICI